MGSTFGVKVRNRAARTFSIPDNKLSLVAKAFGIVVEEYAKVDLAEEALEQEIINCILKRLRTYRSKELSKNPDISDLIIEN